ncbi:putative membrane protein [Bacillus cereus]|nr:putative membrane protein [Bacillus cereus]
MRCPYEKTLNSISNNLLYPPILTEILQGILAPLSKWYIGIPIVLCSISFDIYRIFQPKYSKIFPFIGIMIYMIYSLLGPMFKLYMKL